MLTGLETKRIIHRFDCNFCQGRDPIDPAGAQKDESGSAASAVFEDVDRPEQVVLDQLAAAGYAVDTGQNAGIGRCVDDPVDLRQGLEVGRAADIAVKEPDPEFLQDACGYARFRAG